MTVSAKKDFSNLLNSMSSREQKLHLALWICGYIFFSWPSLEFRFGVFFSGDYSSIIPNAYGSLLNSLLFYSIAIFTSLFFQLSPKKWVVKALSLLILVSSFEILLDVLFYFFFYQSISWNISIDVFIGTFLLNTIFFLVPGLVFGVLKKERLLSLDTESSKIIIKESGNSHIIEPDNLLFIKSEGNYSIYQVRNRKKIMVRESLKSVESKLPPFFKRCHRSYIINTRLIEKKTYDSVLIDHHSIPLGRTFREKI